MAAAVVAVAGIGTVVVNEMVGDDGGQDIEVVAETVGVISGDGAELAEVTVDEAGAEHVELTGAPHPDADHTYQLWSTDGAEPVSLGVLGTGSDREVEVTLPEGTTRVAISDRAAGGSSQPTTAVGQGELSLPRLTADGPGRPGAGTSDASITAPR